MPSRLYLPASGVADVSPTFSAEWEHQQGVRRPMSPTKGSTALATQAYVPDAADHLVDQDALHVQFVSNSLAAQTIAAQTVTLSVKGLMAHANNAQQLTWKLFIWTAAGAVGPTVLAIRRAVGAYTTTLVNRSDSITSTAVTVGAGDRLVLEIGTGGLPTATGGIQGHNASLRWGEDGATDAALDNSSTSLTENPWLEFANVLSFVVPATTGSAVVRARGQAANTARRGATGSAVVRVRDQVVNTAQRGATATPSVRVGARTTVATTSFHPVTTRRAVVTWAAFSTPLSTAPRTTGEVRLSVASRGVSTLGPKAVQVAASGQARVRMASDGQRQTAGDGALRTASRVATVGQHGGITQGILAVAASTRLTGLHAALAVLELRATAQSLSEGVVDHQTAVMVCATAWTPLIGMIGTINDGALRAVLRFDLVTTSVHPPPGPYDPLAPIDLGTLYRGDTLILPIWQARNQRGFVLDLTEVYLRFTAKTDLAISDASAPTIQVSSDDGGIVILDAMSGFYRVTLQPDETQQLLDDTVFTFDVQLYANSANVYTIRRGLLTIVRDVTRTPA